MDREKINFFGQGLSKPGPLIVIIGNCNWLINFTFHFSNTIYNRPHRNHVIVPLDQCFISQRDGLHNFRILIGKFNETLHFLFISDLLRRQFFWRKRLWFLRVFWIINFCRKPGSQKAPDRNFMSFDQLQDCRRVLARIVDPNEPESVL